MSEAQFYIEGNVDRGDLLNVLKEAMGFDVETADERCTEPCAFLSLDDYPGEFSTHAMVSWGGLLSPTQPAPQVAHRLAVRLGRRVVTDLLDDDARFSWCLAESNGKLWAVAEDEDATDSTGGLVLDSDRRELLP